MLPITVSTRYEREPIRVIKNHPQYHGWQFQGATQMRLNFRGVRSTVMNKYLGSEMWSGYGDSTVNHPACEHSIGLEPHNWITNPVLYQLSYSLRGKGQVVYTFKGLPQTLCA